MSKIEITFRNNIDIRTLVQIFKEQTLISTGMAGPGESCILSAEPSHYDIFFKHGVTGWELTRKMDWIAKSVTLSKHKGQYVIT